MSSAFSRGRQRLAPRDGYDVAFCHNCFHEWYLNEGASSPPPPCPRCEAEVVEIVEDNDNDPRGYQQSGDLPMFAELLMGLSGLGALGRPGNRSESQMSDSGHDNHIDSESHDGRDRNAPYNPFSNPGNHGLGHGLGNLQDHLHDNHNELDDQLDNDMYSDPDEADIEEEEYHGPNNVYMYRSTQRFDPGDPDVQQPQAQQSQQQQPSSREPQREPQPVPQREPQDPPRRAPAADPADPRAILDTFMQMMHGLGDGNRTGRSGPETLFSAGGDGNVNGSTTPRRQTTTINTNFGTTSFTIATGPLQPNAAGGNFNAVFANIMGNVGPPNVDAQNQGQNQGQRPIGQRGTGTLPPFTDALQNLLAMIVGQGATAAVNGDAVHSDEALDRIITMLMENNRGPTGAPPAAQSALDELERKKVDAKMLEPDGHAECTICITEVQLNEEVLYLPCKHWFHEECALTWLRQHNTCPVCRYALAPASNAPNSSNNTNNSSSNRSNPVPGAAPSAEGDQAQAQQQPQQPPQPQHRPISDFLRNHRLNTSQHMTDHLRIHQENVNRARLNAIRAVANRPTDPGPSSPASGPLPAFNPFPPGTFTSGNTSPFHTGSPFGSPFQQPSPSPTPSAAHTPASSSSHNASHYRSSRVPEREAAAERERRRRDSRSPTASNSDASRRMRFIPSSSSSQQPSQTDRLREQREQQQQQREQREQQQREQQREHQDHIDAWMDYDEFPSAASAFSTRGRQQTGQSQPQHSGQTQTQNGSGSNGTRHYFWYSSMGPTHTGVPDSNAGGNGNNNNNNNNNSGQGGNTDPSSGGMYDGTSDRNAAHTAHINIQLPGLSSVFSNNNHGGDPSSGGNESGPANNASNGNGQNNSGNNNNNNGGGGFFSSLFRGFGGGNASNAGRRS